jgi:hypothetical protein
MLEKGRGQMQNARSVSSCTWVDRLKLPGRPKGSKDKRQRASTISNPASNQEQSPPWRLDSASGDKADSSPRQHAAGPAPHAPCCIDTSVTRSAILGGYNLPRMMCAEASESGSTQAPSPTTLPVPSPSPLDCARSTAAAASAASESPLALPEPSQAEDPFHDDRLYWPDLA